MTNTEKKAKELGLKYFPDELNVFARTNVDAYKAEYACLEMAKWKEQQLFEKAIECCIGDFNFFINVNDVNDYIEYIQSQGLKSGDKVKVILIKTEQTIDKGE